MVTEEKCSLVRMNPDTRLCALGHPNGKNIQSQKYLELFVCMRHSFSLKGYCGGLDKVLNMDFIEMVIS